MGLNLLKFIVYFTRYIFLKNNALQKQFA